MTTTKLKAKLKANLKKAEVPLKATAAGYTFALSGASLVMLGRYLAGDNSITSISILPLSLLLVIMFKVSMNDLGETLPNITRYKTPNIPNDLQVASNEKKSLGALAASTVLFTAAGAIMEQDGPSALAITTSIAAAAMHFVGGKKAFERGAAFKRHYEEVLSKVKQR